jgi:hypothetical protein
MPLVARRGNGEGTVGWHKGGRYVARYFVETPQGRKRKALYGRTRSEVANKLTRAIANREGFVHFLMDWHQAGIGSEPE